jgi:hypothetical protein
MTGPSQNPLDYIRYVESSLTLTLTMTLVELEILPWLALVIV